MLCALSGQSVVDPVVSPASGKVFERSVIEAWVLEKGTDPVTNAPLGVKELVNLDFKPANVELIRSASVPALLKALQNEFNALVLENHEVTQKLRSTQREVNAALRLITRLQAELTVGDAKGELGESEHRASGAHPAVSHEKAHAGEDKDQAENAGENAGESRVKDQAEAAGARADSPGLDSSHPAKRQKLDPASNAMPTLQEAMELHFLDIDATKQDLNARRTAFNKSNEQQLSEQEAANTPVEAPQVQEIKSVRGSTPTLQILGSHALVCNKLVDLESGKETKLRSPTFWVNESTLCVVQNRKIQLTDLELSPQSSAAMTQKVFDIIPHPAGYLLVVKTNSISIHRLFDLDQVDEIHVGKHSSVALHPDGELLFVGRGKSITIYSLAKHLAGDTNALAELDASGNSQSGTITSLAVSPNGYFLAYALDSVAVGIIDLRYEEPAQIFPDLGKPRTPIKTLSFDDAGFSLLVASGQLGVTLLSYSVSKETWTTATVTDTKVAAARWYNGKAICLS